MEGWIRMHVRQSLGVGLMPGDAGALPGCEVWSVFFGRP